MFPGKMVDSTCGSTFASSSNPNKTKVFSFPIAAVTNDHKFSGSLQYKSFISQSVWQKSNTGLTIKVSAGLSPLAESVGKNSFP